MTTTLPIASKGKAGRDEGAGVFVAPLLAHQSERGTTFG